MSNGTGDSLTTDEFPDGDVQCAFCFTDFAFNWDKPGVTATTSATLGSHETKVPDKDWDPTLCPACDNTGDVKLAYLLGSG